MDLTKLIKGIGSQQYFDELGNPLKEDPFFVELESHITTLESPRKVEAFILDSEYAFLGEKTTVCTLITVFGFEVTGISAPVQKEHFNEELGKKLAFNKAVMELEKFHAYLVTYINSQNNKK